MTAAQVVMTRVPSAPQQRGKDEASVRQAGQDGGFEDTLDRADAAGAEAPASGKADESVAENGKVQEAGGQSSSTRGHKRGDDAETSDDATAETATDTAAAVVNQITIAQAPGFALALAALTAPALQQDQAATPQTDIAPQSIQPASDEAVLNAILSGSDAKPKVQDVKMPGETDPVTETLSLLGIAEEDVADVQASAENTSVKVIGQETHLARSQKAPSALEAYAAQIAQTTAAPTASASQAPAQTGETETADGGDTADAPAVLGRDQAPVSAAATSFSNDSDGGTSSGQDSRQDKGQAQQATSAPQTAVPASTQLQGAAASSTRSTATDATFASYADGLSPGSQIARSVTSEIANADRSGSNTDGVLKVLHIELKPANLGSVTVRMSLKDDVISLHMEASRHETVAAIEKERSALTSALKSSGYVVDEITAQTVDASRGASGRIEAATNDGSMSSSFSQGESQGRSQAQQEFSGFGRGQGGQRGGASDVSLTPPNSAGESAGEISRPRAGAIYV